MRTADENAARMGRRAGRTYRQWGIMTKSPFDGLPHPRIQRLAAAWWAAFNTAVPKPVFPPPTDSRLN